MTDVPGTYARRGRARTLANLRRLPFAPGTTTDGAATLSYERLRGTRSQPDFLLASYRDLRRRNKIVPPTNNDQLASDTGSGTAPLEKLSLL